MINLEFAFEINWPLPAWKSSILRYFTIFKKVCRKVMLSSKAFRWHAPFLIIFQVFLLPQSPYYHASEHLLLASYYMYSSYCMYSHLSNKRGAHVYQFWKIPPSSKKKKNPPSSFIDFITKVSDIIAEPDDNFSHDHFEL